MKEKTTAHRTFSAKTSELIIALFQNNCYLILRSSAKKNAEYFNQFEVMNKNQ